MKNKNSTKFALRLKKRCFELGYSKMGLAKMTGIGRNSIHNYASGAYPRGDNAISLAKALECSLDWLLMGVGPAPQDPNELREVTDIAIGLKKSLETMSNDINSLSQKIDQLITAAEDPKRAKVGKVKPLKKRPSK